MDSQRRVVSGMRPTGRLHLGHYHGVLKNWVRLQHEYECFFCIVDWHALTTDYDDPSNIPQASYDMPARPAFRGRKIQKGPDNTLHSGTG